MRRLRRNRFPREVTVTGLAVRSFFGHDFPMFTAAKDALSSHAARTYVNGLIKRYGEVSELKIDSRNKSVEIVCMLTGENESVKVLIENYRIVSDGAKRFVEITALTCSRPWLHNLLEDHVRGRRLELPSWAAAAL